jgi:GNAT superfamily N-acetyltransferase
MDSRLRIELLADHPAALPMLRSWFETEWESYYGPSGPGDAESDLLACSNRMVLPIGFVAFCGQSLYGVAALKLTSLATHSHLGPWAAAGLVHAAFRRRGIGSALVRMLEETARGLGHSRIHCATSTANRILERRNWQFMERVADRGEDVTIYQKSL